MKHRLKFFLIIIIAFVGQSFFGNSATMQTANETEKTFSNKENCVKVTLITESSSYSLKKENQISAVIRIDNYSNRTIKLSHSPIFNLDRIGIVTSIKTKPDTGNKFIGRFLSEEDDSDNKELIIKKNSYLEFLVNINELEVYDSYSSANIWRNIFLELEKGEYSVIAKVFLGNSDRVLISNKINLSYK